MHPIFATGFSGPRSGTSGTIACGPGRRRRTWGTYLTGMGHELTPNTTGCTGEVHALILLAMVTAQEVRDLTGKRVALQLARGALADRVAGRLVGTLEAADGLVAVVEREGEPGQFTCNYQHIIEITELS